MGTADKLPTKVNNRELSRVAVDDHISQKFQAARERGQDFSKFVEEFLQNFLSPDTRRAYQKDLEAFFSFVRAGGERLVHPRDIAAYHFQVYRDHMIEQKLASSTINRRLVGIRSFMKWALAAKMIDHNPLDAVKLPKVQTESPTAAFDDDEVVQMLNAPDTSEHKGNLHRMMMVLLFNLGLRRSELTHIKLSHFTRERGHTVLRVHGKGDKLRLIPINQQIFQEIQNYLNRLGEQGMLLDPDDYLLQTSQLKKNDIPIDGSTIYRTINRYAKELGINKKVSPHSCRATVISHLLDTQQAGIRDVAIFAGHANITTTERYDKRRQNLDQNAAYQVDYFKKK